MKNILTLRNSTLVIFLVISMFLSFTLVHAGLQMEWGDVNSTAEGFVEVNLTGKYINPIVVVTPEYTTTTQANGIAVWLANVSSESFEFKTSNENGASTDSITVHYVVMEEGVWTLPGSDIKVEAGSLSTTRTGSVGTTTWDCPANGEAISFTRTFDNNPLVLATRGSNNNPSVWGTVHVHGNPTYNTDVDTDDMCIGLSVSKALTPGTFTNAETIYWIALDEGNGTLNGIEYEVLWNLADTGTSGGNWINGFGDTPPFSQAWAHTWIGEPDIIPVGTTSVRGSDGAWPVLYDTGNTANIRMFVDEANERAHTGSESGGGIGFDYAGAYSGNGTAINNASLNDSRIRFNDTVRLEVNVTDLDGNGTVVGVNATFRTPNGSSFVNHSLSQEFQNTTQNATDQESGVQNFVVDPAITVSGEAGRIDIANFTWALVAFNNTYNETPIVVATPGSNNAGNNDAPIPAINMINTTHFNVTICVDDGSTTCDTTTALEELHYFVFNKNITNNYSWVEVGTVDVATDGVGNVFSFNKTFANTPYVFTTSQTDVDNDSTVAPVSWLSTVSTAGATIVGCDHPGTGDTCNGSSTETFGYIAIDINNVEWNNFASGTQTISASTWTAISFGQTYTNAMVMVTVNSESGGQDPKTPMARSITTTGADVRYCEQDGGNYCDTHNGEITRWFALENGDIQVGTGSLDVDQDHVYYNDTSNIDVSQIHNITLYINITEYNNSGSTQASNNASDVIVEMFYGTGWHSLGNLSLSGTGMNVLTTTNTTVLNAWKSKGNRDVRLQAVDLDYNTSNFQDNISWEDIIIEFSYETPTGTWFVHYSNTSEVGEYNVTDIYATDGTNMAHVSYTNLSFIVDGVPEITLYLPANNSKLITNGTVEFVFFIDDDTALVNCTLMINNISNTSTLCSTGVNTSLLLNVSNGLYNWSVNVTDGENNMNESIVFYFTAIQDVALRVNKSITYINTNISFVNIIVQNLLNNTTALARPFDFTYEHFVTGSWNILYDYRNQTLGYPLFGNYSRWDLDLNESQTREINFSHVGTGDYERLRNYVVGLE